MTYAYSLLLKISYIKEELANLNKLIFFIYLFFFTIFAE